MAIFNSVYGKEVIPLKSYEEIKSMATSEWYPRTNTIAELNNNPQMYHDLFDSWWNLSNDYMRSVAWQSANYNADYITWILNGDYCVVWDLYKVPNTWQIWRLD